MCGTCGCSEGNQVAVRNLQTGSVTTFDPLHIHDHKHEHVHADGTRHSHSHADDNHAQDHQHPHEHVHADGTHHVHAHESATVPLETRILAKNDAIAERNRAWFAGREILALNLVSSPGSGKTTLLERTIRDLKDKHAIAVIEGDQATSNDGDRIRAAGAPAVQVNTGTGCHLEADMVARGLAELKPVAGSILLIENVGNLVCPALFDLGERAKVLIFSVTEGEDKPLKYPNMFAAAELVILSKIDLLPHLDFDVDAALTNIKQVNPHALVLQLSSRSGEGLDPWYGWIADEVTVAGVSLPQLTRG